MSKLSLNAYNNNIIDIGTASWGSIIGTLSNQTDLQDELNALQTNIETKADSSQLANYLPLSGGTMTGRIRFNIEKTGSIPISAQNYGYEDGVTTAPTSEISNFTINIQDINGTQVGSFYNIFTSDSKICTGMHSVRIIDGTRYCCYLNIYIDDDGTMYANCPTVTNYSDSSNKIATTAFVKSVLSGSGYGLATYSKGSTGYIKFANGIIIQWGSTTTDNTTITLPVTMSNANYVVLLGNYDDGSLSGNQSGAWKLKTTTGFYLQFGACDGLDWTVIGY